MKKLLLIPLILLFGSLNFAENPQFYRAELKSFRGSLSGVVVDSSTAHPMEYANVVVYNKINDIQVTGGITDNRGRFLIKDVPAGLYFLHITFMGYSEATIDSVLLTPREPEVNLGTLQLRQISLNSEEVTVEAERPLITYHLDKKVLDAASLSTAAAGTAVDLLENAPSVQVDIEGNVSLRGSENFKVLIDGRPSILDPQDALQQIPASAIDNIELITNPSARYSAEGTAGIINVILKRNALEGVTGLINLNAGTNDKYGGELTFSYKTDTYATTLSADYNNKIFSADREQRFETYNQKFTSYANSDGSGSFGRISDGLRASFEYNLTPVDLLRLSGRMGSFEMLFDQHQYYSQWTSLNPLEVQTYTSLTDRSMAGMFYSLNTDYVHQFPTSGHELSAMLQYNMREGNEITTDELRPEESIISEGRQLKESNPNKTFRFKLDYTYPLSQSNNLETGFQSDLFGSDSNTDFYNYDTLDDSYQKLPQLSNHILYDKNIFASYAMYSGQSGQFGYQLGLRGEYTDRDITIPGADKQFSIDRMDYFPSLHTSYKFNRINQVMASYSRRIDRPRDWYLEPFETWTDAYNVRIGNPDLKPEYIDSYELGYQTRIHKTFISLESYYRVTSNKIVRLQNTYNPEEIPEFIDDTNNITLHSVENFGDDYRLGVEFLTRFTPAASWTVNLMGNVYNYRIEGTQDGFTFSQSSFNWNLGMNNSVLLWKNGSLQLKGFYRSPTVSAQGKQGGLILTDFAIRQDLLDGTLSAILQIRDVLGTANREFVTSGPNFYRYNYMERESPVVMLTLKYNFNNYKTREFQRDQRNIESTMDFEAVDF
ncbi:MAG: TonB-dependent receptor [Candidatus Marinimicrobia bacterium]|nr:TonB-dependent receptor [Candidatus Neomarinimicrobiota bacterium]